MLKPNKIKLLLAVCVILAGGWLTITIVLRTIRSDGPAEILRQLPKNVDISLRKIHYTDTKDGEKRWDLVAEKVEYDKVRDRTNFSNVRMDIFSKGKPGAKITLNAERAAYHNKTGNIDVEGNVTAVNEAGMKFETERLRYQSSRAMIDTRDPVRFTDDRLSVEGTGMEFMLKEKSMRILRNVTARVGGRTQ